MCQLFMYLYSYYLNFIDRSHLRSGIFALGFYHSLLIGKFYNYEQVDDSENDHQATDVDRQLQYLNLFVKHFHVFTEHRKLIVFYM